MLWGVCVLYKHTFLLLKKCVYDELLIIGYYILLLFSSFSHQTNKFSCGAIFIIGSSFLIAFAIHSHISILLSFGLIWYTSRNHSCHQTHSSAWSEKAYNALYSSIQTGLIKVFHVISDVSFIVHTISYSVTWTLCFVRDCIYILPCTHGEQIVDIYSIYLSEKDISSVDHGFARRSPTFTDHVCIYTKTE